MIKMIKSKIAGIAVTLVVAVCILSWIFTAPYMSSQGRALSNQGFDRTPGVIIGGTLAPSPDDFSSLNESVPGPMMMKLSGFPPFVTYLLWVGTPDGVISASRPDGGYWSQRLREGGGDGLLRIGNSTYEMNATEIHGDERLAMMGKWAAKANMPLDQTLYQGGAPLHDWEVFFWAPRS
ncbi:MAG: hypothetical protein QMC06_00845 [Gammaproteobacteria bacterium]|jgi:hypothetical protein